MPSVFDSPHFNQQLFFPRPDKSPVPPGAIDFFVPADGILLHVRWHRHPHSPVTVLLFHGNGEVVADYDDLAKSYADCGADLAVADYRGYGQSEGTPSLRNLLTDAPRILEALTEAGAESVVVMGRSLGSVCAAALYPAPPELVIGFIWESGVASLDNLVRRRGLSVPEAVSEADRSALDPCRKLARGQLPLLILHGKQDDLISPEEAEQALAAAATKDKSLCLIPGRGPNDLAASPLYWQSIKTFLHRLTPPPPVL